MRHFLHLISASLCVFALSACSSNNIAVSGGELPATATTGVTSGNWFLQASSQKSRTLITNVGGPLAASGATLSVTTTPASVCLPAYSPIIFSGVLTNDQVTLTSPPVSGNSRVMTIHGTVRYGTNIEGTYTLTSSFADDTCGGDFGTVQGTLVPSLTAAWTGVIVESEFDVDGNPIVDFLNVPIKNTAAISAVITQAAAPIPMQTVAGTKVSAFPLSGTLTFTDSLCYQTATIDSTQSLLSSTFYQLAMKTDTGDILYSSGAIDPTRGTPIGLSYTVPSGPCQYYQVKGNLNNP